MSRVCFLDNDILCKLVAFQLFEEAIATLKITKNELQVLATSRFVFRSKRKKKVQYSDEVWAQVIDLVTACKTIPDLDEAGIEELKQLEVFRNEIHGGEAALIAATRLTADFLLLTGDKKCLKFLSRIPEPIYQRLCGRVVCLEQIILKLIAERSFEAVRDRILPRVSCDRTLQICFGYSEPADEREVILGLESYIREIQQCSPALLMEL